MNRPLRISAAVAALALVGATAYVVFPPRPAVDLGEWRVVVLQSDDWGLEGWFPDAGAAEALAELVEDLPFHLRAYARGGLETAEDVRALADLFAAHADADGLPLVLQANHVVAAPTVTAETDEDADFGWPLHPSGEGTGRYARPGLREAVDAAIERGVWWPELHGLTHFDLEAYARARGAGDATAELARGHETFAYEGWLRHTELDGADPERAASLAREAVARFELRFGRRPHSVIAPDYRWGDEDESAWAEQGIEVVQAKREQIDRSLRPHTRIGRVKKWFRQRWQTRTGPLHALDRPAHLEPYGDADPAARQGAIAAAEAVRKAWRSGQPGVISVHRIQLVAFDPAIARAGRDQLQRTLALLEEDGPLRCLVDHEVVQLQRRGWSSLRRGPWIVVRNFSGEPVEVVLDGAAAARRFAPGTHLLPAGGAPEPGDRP